MDSLRLLWDSLERVWGATALGVPVSDAICALAVLIASFFLRVHAADLLVAIAGRFTRRHESAWPGRVLHAARRPLRLLVVAVGVKLSVVVSGLSGKGLVDVDGIVRTLVIASLFWTALRLVDPAVAVFMGRFTRRSSETALVEFLSNALRAVVFFLGLSAVLQLWGFNVIAVLGSLGLLGAALALGAKEFFSDVLAGVVLLTERIADRGDWVRSSAVDGTVEQIGLRATRIRRFDKTLTTVPNRFLAAEPLTNLTRMTQRRIYWTIGVEYRSEEPQLKAIVREISEFIHQHEGFETDPTKVLTFVFLDSFGDSSVNIMVYCFTRTTVWGEWLALKEELAYAVKHIVESHGAAFAFPSTSLYVESLPFGTPEPFPSETPTRV